MSNTVHIEGSEIVIVRTRLYSGAMNYAAYEPSVGGYASTSHSVLFRIGERVYGAVSSRRITAELDKLPAGSDERYNAVHAFHEKNKRVAEGAIMLACPEAKSGVCTGMGDITVYSKER